MCTHRTAHRTYLQYVPYGKMKTPKEIKDKVRTMPYSKGGQIRFFCWFEAIECRTELLSRIFAAKKTHARGIELYEIIRETIGGTFYLQRNLYWEGMNGWQVWFPAENEIVPDDWCECMVDKFPGIWIELINPEVVFTVEKFKYCGYRGGFSLAPYLRMYLEEPGIEFFGKMMLRPTKALVKKAKTDPNFRKYLRKLTPDEVQRANIYGPNALLNAYKQKTTNFAVVASDITDKIRHSRQVTQCGAGAAMKKGKWKAEKVLEYIDAYAKGNCYSYGDYIKACDYLQLDLKDTKVTFPKQFQRMHDLRINQMHSRKAAEDAEKRKELHQRFREVAETLKPFEMIAEGFAIVIPTDAYDLVKEGEALSHCVGRMGYDSKEANRKSFIAFLRKSDAIGKPFVTIEFGFKTKTVLQCYGAKDSRPPESVLKFVDKWAETVKKELLEQERAAAATAAEEERAMVAATA